MSEHWNSVAQELRPLALESDSLGLSPSSANYLCKSVDKLFNLSVPQHLMCQMKRVQSTHIKNFLLHGANELIYIKHLKLGS